jgi:alkylation response protein AidB-like acyl-CoA dehydrogenase
MTTAIRTDAAHDPVAAARAIGPRVRELAARTERERRVPAELVRELVEAGLFHVMLPRSAGGLECDPVTACQAVEEVSAWDGSTGWCVMLAAQSAGFSGFLPEGVAREVWGNGGILASVARPIGKAIPTLKPEDGFTVTGRWPFASGSSHATWFGGECQVFDGDEPRRDQQGNVLSRMVLVPRDDVTVHDTWDTTGLRGTASHDFSIDNVFVPGRRGFYMLFDEPIHAWPLFRAPALVFVTHGSQALGVGRAAVASAVETAVTKIGWGTDRPMSENARMQMIVAEATVLVESARQYLYGVTGELWEAVQAGKETPQQRSRVRLATSHAARASVQAVDLMHGALATSSIFTKSPLERQFRDIHTAAAHVMVSPLTLEAAGRVEMGLEAGFPFF